MCKGADLAPDAAHRMQFQTLDILRHTKTEGTTVASKFEAASQKMRQLNDYIPKLSSAIPKKVQYPQQCGAFCFEHAEDWRLKLFDSLWLRFEAWAKFCGGVAGLLKEGLRLSYNSFLLTGFQEEGGHQLV